MSSFKPQSAQPTVLLLDLSGNPLTDTAFLNYFPSLRELNLSNCIALNALDIPENVQIMLRRIDISNTKIASLYELSLPALEYLDVSLTGVTRETLPTNLYSIQTIKFARCRLNVLEFCLAVLYNKCPLLQLYCVHKRFENRAFIGAYGMCIGGRGDSYYKYYMCFNAAGSHLLVSILDTQIGEFIEFNKELEVMGYNSEIAQYDQKHVNYVIAPITVHSQALQIVPNPLQAVLQYETAVNSIQLVFSLYEHLAQSYKLRVPYSQARQLLFRSALAQFEPPSPIGKVTVTLDAQHDFYFSMQIIKSLSSRLAPGHIIFAHLIEDNVLLKSATDVPFYCGDEYRVLVQCVENKVIICELFYPKTALPAIEADSLRGCDIQYRLLLNGKHMAEQHTPIFNIYYSGIYQCEAVVGQFHVLSEEISVCASGQSVGQNSHAIYNSSASGYLKYASTQNSVNVNTLVPDEHIYFYYPYHAAQYTVVPYISANENALSVQSKIDYLARTSLSDDKTTHHRRRHHHSSHSHVRHRRIADCNIEFAVQDPRLIYAYIQTQYELNQYNMLKQYYEINAMKKYLTNERLHLLQDNIDATKNQIFRQFFGPQDNYVINIKPPDCTYNIIQINSVPQTYPAQSGASKIPERVKKVAVKKVKVLTDSNAKYSITPYKYLYVNPKRTTYSSQTRDYVLRPREQIYIPYVGIRPDDVEQEETSDERYRNELRIERYRNALRQSAARKYRDKYLENRKEVFWESKTDDPTKSSRR